MLHTIDSGTSVKVAVRIRPLSPEEAQEDETLCINIIPGEPQVRPNHYNRTVRIITLDSVPVKFILRRAFSHQKFKLRRKPYLWWHVWQKQNKREIGGTVIGKSEHSPVTALVLPISVHLRQSRLIFLSFQSFLPFLFMSFLSFLFLLFLSLLFLSSCNCYQYCSSHSYYFTSAHTGEN